MDINSCNFDNLEQFLKKKYTSVVIMFNSPKWFVRLSYFGPKADDGLHCRCDAIAYHVNLEDAIVEALKEVHF